MGLRMTAYEQTKICSYKDANFTCISMVSEMQALMLSNKGVMVAGPLHVLELLQLSSGPQVPQSRGHLESGRLEREMHVSKGCKTTFRIQAVQKSSHSGNGTKQDSK